MQFEMAYLSCPLCKRQLPASSPEHSFSTRLCESCQTIVLTAFHGANSTAVSSAAVVLQDGARAQVQMDPPPLDHAVVGVPALFEAAPADALSFSHESRPPIPFDTPDSVKFDFYDDDDPDDRPLTFQTDSPAFSENGSTREPEEVFEGFVQSIGTATHESAKVDDSQRTEQAVESAFARASVVEHSSECPPSIPEEAATDPWEAPLPAWDYSHSEWPVFVGQTQRRSFRKLRSAIATVVVLASVAGFYFLIYRPSTPQRRTATDTGTTAQVSAVEPSALAASRADSSAAGQTEPAQSDKAAAATSQPAGTERGDALTRNDNGAQGQFSLQAAAFPSLGGADEFAEKLKQAGLPSYVVPADLVRRGRWFRVRVGRFNAATDAQRFAGEARQRARAAGLAVQFIVCQSDQP